MCATMQPNEMDQSRVRLTILTLVFIIIFSVQAVGNSSSTASAAPASVHAAAGELSQ